MMDDVGSLLAVLRLLTGLAYLIPALVGVALLYVVLKRR